SSSKSGSSARTASPSFFNQRATVPSVIDSPTAGTLISVAMAAPVLGTFSRRLDLDLFLLDDHRLPLPITHLAALALGRRGPHEVRRRSGDRRVHELFLFASMHLARPGGRAGARVAADVLSFPAERPQARLHERP